MSAEQNYAIRSDEKRQLWSMKISPKLRYIAGIAARADGKTLSHYVESLLEKSFATITITEAEPDEEIPAKTLAELAETLYSGTEANRFLTLVRMAPWLVSDGESKLLRILRHSDYYAPKGFLHGGRIQENWETLAAIRDGEADVDILPIAHQPRGPLAFGMKGDKEKIALYRNDPAKF